MTWSIQDGREDGKRAIADKILKRIRELEKSSGYNRGRWAWELLQNAKDSIAENERRNLSVRIKISQESVDFSHNGGCFTEKDIRSIISQISFKEASEKKIGRFGTGFLTTYLLSKEILIKGIVKDEDRNFHRFSFFLDRTGKKVDQLIPQIELSRVSFVDATKKIENPDEEAFNTSFVYKLRTAEQRSISTVGIKEFSKLIPYVLAFSPKITKIEIVDITSETSTVFEQHESIEEDSIRITRIRRIIDDGNGNIEKGLFRILSTHDGEVSVAARVKKISGKYKVGSLRGIPKLFCDFPLIGTENFPFPVVVNSFFFSPQTERDGIWLTCSKDAEVERNKRLMENAVELYKKILSYLEGQEFQAAYHIADTNIAHLNEEAFDIDWYKEKIQKKIREAIKKTRIVEGDAQFFLFKDVYFPDKSLKEQEREKIRDLSHALSVNSLPRIEDVHGWTSIAWEDCSVVDINDLIADLEGVKTVKALSKTLQMPKEKSITWLIDCLEFIYEIGGLSKTLNAKVTPNQNGLFKKLNELSADLIEDEHLKDISCLLGHDYRKELICKDIKIKDIQPSEVTAKEIADSITKALEQEDEELHANKKNATLKLIEWFEANPEKAKEIFRSLYRKKEKLLVSTIEDKHSLYKVLRGSISLRDLARTDLADRLDKLKALDNLLSSIGANSVSELERLLKSSSSKPTEITIEDLASLGITSLVDLKKALEDSTLSSQFSHESIPTPEMFKSAQEKIGRAKKNVIEYLKKQPEYNCDDYDNLSTTVVGIRKKDMPISIVIRPSDNNEVIIYYGAEKETLDDPNTELWIENGKDEPIHFTLGKILKTTGINRIPL